MSLFERWSKQALVGAEKGMLTISDMLMSRLPLWTIGAQTHWRPLGGSRKHASELSYSKYIHQLPSVISWGLLPGTLTPWHSGLPHTWAEWAPAAREGSQAASLVLAIRRLVGEHREEKWVLKRYRWAINKVGYNHQVLSTLNIRMKVRETLRMAPKFLA